MKKISMIIICIITFNLFTPIYAEEKVDVFKKYQISKLAAIIDQDFSDLSVGANASAAGFYIAGPDMLTEVVLDGDNKCLYLETTKKGDAFIDMKFEATGIIVAQFDVKIQNITSYAQLPNIIGNDANRVANVGSFVSLDGKLNGSFTNNALSQNFKQSTWINVAIVVNTNSKTSDLYLNGVLAAKDKQFLNPIVNVNAFRIMLRDVGNKVFIDNIRVGVSSMKENKKEEFIDNRPNLSFPAEMVGVTEEEKSRQREAFKNLQIEMVNAIARGDKQFVIPKDYYRSGAGGRLKIIGATDIDIEGSDSTFISETRDHNVFVSNCKNVTLKNIHIDADPLYFTQGVVTAFDREKKTMDILIDNGYYVPAKSIIGSRLMLFTPDGKEPLSAGFNDTIASMELIEPKKIRISQRGRTAFAPEVKFELGVRVGIPSRGGGSGLEVNNSDYCTFQNVGIYSAGGFGVHENLGEGGNTYDKLRVIRRPGTNRLISVSADGFHSSQAKNGPIIKNSEIAHAEDDLLNIQGFMDVVYRQINPTTYYVASTAGIGFGPGSLIEFYDVEKVRKIDEAKVVSVSTDVPASVAPNVKKIATEVQNQTGVTIREPMPGLMLKVEFDRPLKVKPYDLMYYSDTCGSGTVIKDSHFHDGFIRGLYIRSKSTIENNVIERISGQGILINTDIYWLEGPNAKDVTINNNKFIDCVRGMESLGIPGAIAIGTLSKGRKPYKEFYYSNISITNNEFINSGGTAIFIANVENSMIENNKIVNSFAFPIPKSPVGWSFGYTDTYAGIYINNSKDITVRNNEISGNPDWVVDIINKSK